MGTLAGGPGLIVATPLSAAALVLVKEAYVKDEQDEKRDSSAAFDEAADSQHAPVRADDPLGAPAPPVRDSAKP